MTERRPFAVVIEDDPPTRSLLLRLVRFHGFLAHGFRTAEEALAWLATQQAPAMISVDLGLPGMGGSAFCLAARKQPHLAEVPIIVASSDVDPGALAHLQCNAVIRKPFEAGAFLDLLDEIAPNHAAAG